MPTPIELLSTYWGFDRFRPLQEEIIGDLLADRDVLALMATGGGKSLCYQIPALSRPGLCLVVSPLIALMKDQADALQEKDIPVGVIHTGQSWQDVDALFQQALRDRLKFLFVSPERLETRLFKEYLPALDVNLIAVDEAHCISEWGHDFRPSYRRIALLREALPGVPVLALTATATPEVQEDICLQLKLKTPSVFRGTLLRPNLSLCVTQEPAKRLRLATLLIETPGSGIVYCRSRKATTDIASFLREQGVTAEAYHGGMGTGERDKKQEAWMSGAVRIMVSTNAFGMGIDKSDVRSVIHMDAPDSLENYYQEAGRAGRDGAAAQAVVLFDDSDIHYLEQLPDARFPGEDVIRDTYRDLVHFLQIPSGSGDMTWYDFSLETFLARFNRRSATTLYALKALEQEEFLLYADQVRLPPSLHFTTSRADLRQIQTDNPALSPLIDVLLRKYPGILHYPTRISEKWLSRLIRQEESAVVTMLQHMDRLGLVTYAPAVNAPQLRLLQPRVRIEDFQIDYRKYLIRKSAYTLRIGSMIDYLRQTTVCRSLFVNAYFGGPESEPCGVCDVCVARGLTTPLPAPTSV
jgi:ATP-dependent DNA helicase RecQ